MLGERSDQRGLWEADRLYLDHVGKDTFYGLLASLRGQLFRDSDFAGFYCADNGRDSVPPSLLATALLLQPHDKVSDAEAKARADFDIRWKVALGIEIEDRPFAKSTLQVFRAQLILHDKVRAVFESSLRLARESGYLKKRGMRVALDTTNILGRGAVKDTYNLLADGIVRLMRALASVEQTNVERWAKARGYDRYLGSSIKGESAIDWSDRKARAALLGEIVADADRLLEVARQAQGELPEGSPERQGIVAAAELLGELLLQDVEGAGDGIGLKDGVAKDRMVSVHDPEMRHGHKSSSRRFDGHKAANVVDTDSQLITAVEVLPGNAPDNLGALELVERSEATTGVPVEESLGDAAYGDGDTRQAFADAGRNLIARVPGRPNKAHFPKEDFLIDLAAGTCTCPAGQVNRNLRPLGTRTGPTGRIHRLQGFRFDAAVCGVCPLRPRCVAGSSGLGRTVQLHPQEALLQQALAPLRGEDFAGYRQRGVVVEHRLARLVQLGIRQAHYFGRVETKFQLYLAATVANLTLVAAKAGLTGDIGNAAGGDRAASADTGGVAAIFGAILLGQIWSLALLTPAFLPKAPCSTKAFHPHFLPPLRRQAKWSRLYGTTGSSQIRFRQPDQLREPGDPVGVLVVLGSNCRPGHHPVHDIRIVSPLRGGAHRAGRNRAHPLSGRASAARFRTARNVDGAFRRRDLLAYPRGLYCPVFGGLGAGAPGELCGSGHPADRGLGGVVLLIQPSDSGSNRYGPPRT